MTPQETDPDLPVSVQESPGEAWSVVACVGAQVTESSTARMGCMKEVAITCTIVWPQVNNKEGT